MTTNNDLIFSKAQIIAAIKEIREREERFNDKARFCREHNFKLDAVFNSDVADELRRINMLLQNRFNTGYID